MVLWRQWLALGWWGLESKTEQLGQTEQQTEQNKTEQATKNKSSLYRWLKKIEQQTEHLTEQAACPSSNEGY